MASFLDRMPAQLDAGFKGKLRTGVIRRMVGGTGTDSHGRPNGATPVLHTFRGFIDNYSTFRRAQEGIPLESMKCCIFSASIKPPIRPTKDMMVRIDYPAAKGLPARSQWYKLKERFDTDPAEALYEIEAQEAKAP